MSLGERNETVFPSIKYAIPEPKEDLKVLCFFLGVEDTRCINLSLSLEGISWHLSDEYTPKNTYVRALNFH